MRLSMNVLIYFPLYEYLHNMSKNYEVLIKPQFNGNTFERRNEMGYLIVYCRRILSF